MSKLPVIDHAPLDPDFVKHALAVYKSLLVGRPVLVDGKEEYVHTMRSGPVGGRIEVKVWLAGIPKEYDAEEIKIGNVPT